MVKTPKPKPPKEKTPKTTDELFAELRQQRVEIAESLNYALSSCDTAKPSWDSYGGTGQWDVSFIVTAIEHMSDAIAKLADLEKKTEERYGRKDYSYVVPPEDDDG